MQLHKSPEIYRISNAQTKVNVNIALYESSRFDFIRPYDIVHNSDDTSLYNINILRILHTKM